MPQYDDKFNVKVYTIDDYYELFVEKYHIVPKWLYKKIISKGLNFVSNCLLEGLSFSGGTQFSKQTEFNTLYMFHAKYPYKINQDVKDGLPVTKLKSMLQNKWKYKYKKDFKITDEQFDKIMKEHGSKYKHLHGGY